MAPLPSSSRDARPSTANDQPSKRHSASSESSDHGNEQGESRPLIEVVRYPSLPTPEPLSSQQVRNDGRRASEPLPNLTAAQKLKENEKPEVRIVMEPRTQRPTPYSDEEALSKLHGTHPSQLMAKRQGLHSSPGALPAISCQGSAPTPSGAPHMVSTVRDFYTQPRGSPSRPSIPTRLKGSADVPTLERPAAPPPSRHRPSVPITPGGSQIPAAALSHPVPPPALRDALHDVGQDSGLVSPDASPSAHARAQTPSRLLSPIPQAATSSCSNSPLTFNVAYPSLYQNSRAGTPLSPPDPLPSPFHVFGPLGTPSSTTDSQRSSDYLTMRRSAFRDPIEGPGVYIDARPSGGSFGVGEDYIQLNTGEPIPDYVNEETAPDRPSLSGPSSPSSVGRDTDAMSLRSSISAISPTTREAPGFPVHDILAEAIRRADPAHPSVMPHGVGRPSARVSPPEVNLTTSPLSEHPIEGRIPETVARAGEAAQQQRGVSGGRRTSQAYRRPVAAQHPPTTSGEEAHLPEPRQQVNYPELGHVPLSETPVERLDSVDHDVLMRHHSRQEGYPGSKGKERAQDPSAAEQEDAGFF